MLNPAAVVLAMQIAAAGVSVGVGTASEDGSICIAMPPGVLAPGMAVTLIEPNQPQSVLSATIVRSAPSCERFERAMISGPYYLALPATPKVLASANLWVAFAGRLSTRALDSGVVTVQLSPASSDAQVRSCTSHEALHLTLWAGTPLESYRLWHEYFYLGYDVEPSCADRDAGDAAG